MKEKTTTTQTVEQLKEQLKSDDSATRIEALFNLGEDRSRSAIQTLIGVANGEVRRSEYKTMERTESYRPHWYSTTRLTRVVPKQVEVGTVFDDNDQLTAITVLSKIENRKAEKFILKLTKVEQHGSPGNFIGDSSDFGSRKRTPIYDSVTFYKGYSNVRGELADILPKSRWTTGECEYFPGIQEDYFNEDEHNDASRILLEARQRVFKRRRSRLKKT